MDNIDEMFKKAIRSYPREARSHFEIVDDSVWKVLAAGQRPEFSIIWAGPYNFTLDGVEYSAYCLRWKIRASQEDFLMEWGLMSNEDKEEERQKKAAEAERKKKEAAEAERKKKEAAEAERKKKEVNAEAERRRSASAKESQRVVRDGDDAILDGGIGCYVVIALLIGSFAYLFWAIFCTANLADEIEHDDKNVLEEPSKRSMSRPKWRETPSAESLVMDR